MADPFPAPSSDDVDAYSGVVAVHISLGLASVLATPYGSTAHSAPRAAERPSDHAPVVCELA
jgi:hypothetical protein